MREFEEVLEGHIVLKIGLSGPEKFKLIISMSSHQEFWQDWLNCCFIKIPMHDFKKWLNWLENIHHNNTKV